MIKRSGFVAVVSNDKFASSIVAEHGRKRTDVSFRISFTPLRFYKTGKMYFMAPTQKEFLERLLC